jgi:hypothetical protein
MGCYYKAPIGVLFKIIIILKSDLRMGVLNSKKILLNIDFNWEDYFILEEFSKRRWVFNRKGFSWM